MHARRRCARIDGPHDRVWRSAFAACDRERTRARPIGESGKGTEPFVVPRHPDRQAVADRPRPDERAALAALDVEEVAEQPHAVDVPRLRVKPRSVRKITRDMRYAWGRRLRWLAGITCQEQKRDADPARPQCPSFCGAWTCSHRSTHAGSSLHCMEQSAVRPRRFSHFGSRSHFIGSSRAAFSVALQPASASAIRRTLT